MKQIKNIYVVLNKDTYKNVSENVIVNLFKEHFVFENIEVSENKDISNNLVYGSNVDLIEDMKKVLKIAIESV